MNNNNEWILDLFPDGVITISWASTYLKITIKQLREYRKNGGGPGYITKGNRVFYLKTDLDIWQDWRKRLINRSYNKK